MVIFFPCIHIDLVATKLLFCLMLKEVSITIQWMTFAQFGGHQIISFVKIDPSFNLVATKS
jgi:hypothetical protein